MGGELQGLLDQAQETAAAGRHAEALELHQRYHEQSREVTSQFGVRLSFALSRWADLGRGHPPARQALRQTRQAAADRLRAGRPDPDLSAGDQRPYTAHRAHPAHSDFAEVAAISSRPDDEQYAADLFAELDRQAPDVAADCWAAARSLLVHTVAFQVARRYLGDPQRAVVRAASILDQRLTRGFARFPEQLREKMRQDAVNGYIADVREMLTILDGVGAHELSAATRQQAVDAVVWAHVRDDVAAALRAPLGDAINPPGPTPDHDPWGPPEVECSTRDRDPDAGAEPLVSAARIRRAGPPRRCRQRTVAGHGRPWWTPSGCPSPRWPGSPARCRVGRELLAQVLPDHPRVSAVTGDQGSRSMAYRSAPRHG